MLVFPDAQAPGHKSAGRFRKKVHVNEPERLQRRNSERQTFLCLVTPTVQTAVVVTATAILLAPQHPPPTAT